MPKSHMYDVIGIGALNLDFVAGKTTVNGADSQLKEKLIEGLRDGIERPVSKRKIVEFIDGIRTL